MKTHGTSLIGRVLGLSAWLLFAAAAAGLAAQNEDGKISAAEVKQEVSETYETLKQYTIEQRNEAMAVAKKKLEKLDTRIDEMQKTMDERRQEMSQAARENMEKSLEALRQERKDVAEWYGDMQKSTAGAWEEVKKGFAESYERLEKAFNKASKELTKEK